MTEILRRKLRRDVRARRGRFVTIVVTVFLGVALYAASYDAFLNLKTSYESLYDDLAFADLTLVGGDADEVVAAVTAVDGVAAAESRTVAETPIRIAGSHKLLGRAVSVPDGRQPAVNRVMVLAGDYLGAGDGGVLVEQHMADHFDLAVGDSVEVLSANGWTAHRIRGIVASPEYLWPARSRQEVLTSPDDFGVLFAGSDLVADLEAASVVREVSVLFAAEADPAPTAEGVVRAASGAGIIDYYRQDLQPSNAALQQDVSGFGEMSFLFPVLFLGAAGLATSVLLTRLVIAQRAHVGLLRANGFRSRTIFAHYLAYGVGTGVLGAIPGAIAGVLVARAITSVYTDAISVPVTVTAFRPLTLIGGVAFGVVAGALSALGPAMRAARMDPAEAMRGGRTAATGGRSVIERVFPVLRRLPAGPKMVLRSIERSPGRSAATALGVILAAVLILSSWGMIDTVQILLSRQYEQVQRQDAQVFLADPAAIEALAAVPGVTRVEPAAQFAVTIATGDDPYASSLIAFEPDTEMHEFLLQGEATRSPPSSGIYVGSALRTLARLDVGDEVAITLAEGDRTLTETVAGFVNEPLGTIAYAALPHLAAELGVGESTLVNSALLSFGPDVDRAAMRTTVTEVPGVTAYVDSRALFDTANSFMGLFWAFVGVMLVFGVVMAFSLIYNTVSANVAERAGEVGTLKAAGVRQRTIGALITAENLILVLASVGPGLVIGYLSARGLMSSFSSDLFQFDAVIRPTTYVFTGAAIVIAGLLSQRPVLRRVQQLDVATVVRERSL